MFISIQYAQKKGRAGIFIQWAVLKVTETGFTKNQSNRTIIKAVTRILVKPVSVTFKTAHCTVENKEYTFLLILL